MTKSFVQLFLMNLKLIYRNAGGLFFTIAMPIGVYLALSVLPIGRLVEHVRYSDFVLPGVIAWMIMQTGTYSLAYWMIDIKSRGVLKRFLVTPISKSELILSLLAARVLMIILQMVVLTLVGIVFFGATFYGNFLSVLLFGLIGGLIFLLVGLLISTVALTYESAAPITALVSIPMTFLGGIFYPISTLPGSLQTVAKFLPVTYLATGLRDLYTQPAHAYALSQNLWPLLLWLAILLALVLWRFKLEE